ncbi:unnamed protein product [Rhizoctonia solani]|uniref:RRM domain-containing protein n=1 Tax=Rhizoctonia solani TaxID=456999 RepID=A0A8H3A553_9AGAM|nr:unnamed protein product [Rhizoctonia solani]
MSAKVYVGNLSWNTTDDTLRQAFSEYGNVLDSIVMRDRDTGRSRGFGFVTFSNSNEAEAAVNGYAKTDADAFHALMFFPAYMNKSSMVVESKSTLPTAAPPVEGEEEATLEEATAALEATNNEVT